MAALPGNEGRRRAFGVGGTAQAAPAIYRLHARGALATIAGALGQSQPGMFMALSAREDALLALLGLLAYLPRCWRWAAHDGVR